MPNKHFCQGPRCHEQVTTDRFLKSRGVIRGRYAYCTMDRTPNQYGWTPNGSDVYFCSQSCKFDDKCKYWTSKVGTALITYFDLDKQAYRTAKDSWKVRY